MSFADLDQYRIGFTQRGPEGEAAYFRLPVTSRWRWAQRSTGDYVVFTKAEVVKWCEKHIKKDRGAFAVIDGSAPNGRGVVVWFEDPAEGAHFKLKWL